MKQRWILGSESHRSALTDRAQGTGMIPSFKPTVMQDYLVEFWPGAGAPEKKEEQEEAVNMLVEYMQTAYMHSMRLYEPDENKAAGYHRHIEGELRKVAADTQVVVLDLAGDMLAGGASNIRGGEALPAGMPCYISGAGAVQAAILEDPKDTAIYASRLPATGHPSHSKMYALAKGRFPELLQPMIKAVATIDC
jgi:hypothetical protein